MSVASFFGHQIVVTDTEQPSVETQKIFDFLNTNRNDITNMILAVKKAPPCDRYRVARDLLNKAPRISKQFARLVEEEEKLKPMPTTTEVVTFIKKSVHPHTNVPVLDYGAGAGDKALMIWGKTGSKEPIGIFAHDITPRKDELVMKRKHIRRLAGLQEVEWVSDISKLKYGVMLLFNVTMLHHPITLGSVTLEVVPALDELIRMGCALSNNNLVTTMFRGNETVEFWKKPIGAIHFFNNMHLITTIIKQHHINIVGNPVMFRKKDFNFGKKIRPLTPADQGTLYLITPKHDGDLLQCHLQPNGTMVYHNVETDEFIHYETDSRDLDLKFELEKTEQVTWFVRILSINTLKGHLVPTTEYHKITGPWKHNKHNVDEQSEEGFIVHFHNSAGFKQAYHKHVWTYDLDAQEYEKMFNSTKVCLVDICTYDSHGKHLRCRHTKRKPDNDQTRSDMRTITDLLRDSLLRLDPVYLDSDNQVTVRALATYKCSNFYANANLRQGTYAVSLKPNQFTRVVRDNVEAQVGAELYYGFKPSIAHRQLDEKLQRDILEVYLAESHRGNNIPDLEDALEFYLTEDPAKLESIMQNAGVKEFSQTTRSGLANFVNTKENEYPRDNPKGDVYITHQGPFRQGIVSIELPPDTAYVRVSRAYRDGQLLFVNPPGLPCRGQYSAAYGVCVEGYELADDTLLGVMDRSVNPHFFNIPHVEQAERNFIAFFGKSSPFSNFHTCIMGGKITTAEHVYQSRKAEFLKQPCDEILKAATPYEARRIGRRFQPPDDVKVKLMRDVLLEKFGGENPQLVDALLSTGTKHLIEASPADSFFGAGLNSECITQISDVVGKNYMGRLLMEIRDRIRKSQGK